MGTWEDPVGDIRRYIKQAEEQYERYWANPSQARFDEEDALFDRVTDALKRSRLDMSEELAIWEEWVAKRRASRLLA